MTLSISAVLVNNSGAGNETVAAGATTDTDVAKTARVSGGALVALGVYARCTFNASATAGAQAYVFASPEGTQWGSDGGMQVVDIPFMAGADRSVAFSALPGHKYYLLAVKNLDPVQSLTGVYIYAEPQVLSLRRVSMASTTYAAWSTIAPITIANAPGVADYPVRVDLTYAAEMNADFSDIRFVDASDTALSYWIESSTASTSAIVWVKVASGATAISIVYGNAAATSESNGNAVFDFFDDFPGTTIDTTKWALFQAGVTVSGGICTITGSTSYHRGIRAQIGGGGQNTAMMVRAQIPSVQNAPLGYMSAALDVFCTFGPLENAGTNDVTNTYVGGYETKINNFDNTGYHVFEIKRNGSASVIFAIDRALQTTHTAKIPAAGTLLYPTAYLYQKSGTYRLDWAAVRKFQTTEPVCTVGTAGSNSSGPVVPTAAFSADVLSGPAPLTVAFTDESLDTPTSWAWDFENDGVIDSTDQSPSHTYTSAGTYTVTLTATNAGGSDSTTQTVTVTAPVDTTPPAEVTNLQVTSRDATSITWTWTDPTDTDFTKVRVYVNGVDKGYLAKGVQTYTAIGLTPATSYTFAVRTFDLAGNYGSVAYIVSSTTAVPAVPVASFTTDVTTGRAPLTVKFTDTSTGVPTQWSWDFGDGSAHSTAQNPTHAYALPGTYPVTLTVTNGAGEDTEAKLGYITVYITVPLPARETFFQWPYAIEYTIANPPAVDGYQVPLTVAWKPGMRLDFRDLRFRDENLTPCRFRLESYTAGSSATFLIGIWPHQTRLSALYGNGAAVSASDATFCPVLDEFAGAAVDAGTWTDLGGTAVSGGTLTITGDVTEAVRGIRSVDEFEVGSAVRFRASVSANASDAYAGFAAADESSYAVLWCAGASESAITRHADGSTTTTATPMATGYHTVEVARTSSTEVVVSVDGAVVATHTTNVPTAALPVALWGAYTAKTIAVDWITVRPCLEDEPTITYLSADVNPWSPLVNRPSALFDVPFDWSDFDAVKERVLISYTVHRSASDVMYSADVTLHDLIPQGTNFARVKLIEPDHNGVDRLIFFGFLPAQTSNIQAARNRTDYKGWDYGYFIAGRDPGMARCTVPSTTASPGQWLYDYFSDDGQWPDLADLSRALFDCSHIDTDAPAAWGTDALPVRDIVCPTGTKAMGVAQKVADTTGTIFYPKWIDVGKTPTIGHSDPAYQIVRKEAEDYDAGGEGVGYHDTTKANLGGAYRKDGVDIEYFASERGFNVGWIRDGEWLQYTVNFPVADTYVASFRTASEAADNARSFKVYIDGALVDTISVKGTGSYSSFVDNPDTCDIVIGAAGNHTIKLLFDNAGDDVSDLKHMNIASMTFTPTPPDDGSVPPTTVPAIYYCDEADLDTALGLPIIEIPPYDPTLAGAVQYTEDMSDTAGAVIVRYRQPSAPDDILETSDPWIFNGHSFNGLELPIDHVETVETPITTATANTLRDALKAYFAGNWGTVTAKFIRRTDLQLFQRLWFRGHDQIPEYEDDGTTPVLFRIVDITYSVGLARCDVSITAVPARKFSIERQIARTRAPDPATEIEAIARSVLKTLPPALTGTAGSAVGTGSVAVALDRGGTITARGVAANGSRVICTWAEGIGYVASVIAAAV